MHSTGGKAICVIANPSAGKLRRSSRSLARLEGLVEARGQLFCPSGEAELVRTCGEVVALRPEAVAIVGGDGTIMRVLSGLSRIDREGSPPRVAIFPFGTVNTTSTDFGVRGDPWRLLEQMLIGQGTYRRRPFLEVHADRESLLAATFGTGLVSHFFEEYEAGTKKGIARALAIMAKTFFGVFVGHAYARRILGPVSGTLTVQGVPQELREFTLLISSVLKNVGLGMRPVYRAASVAGLIHLVATDLAAHRLGPQVWRVFLGRQLRAPRLFDALVTDFVLEFPEPRRVIVDGEGIVGQRFVVRPAPELWIWSPR
jgi:diacylglycerol kinase (ATP)